MASLNFLSAAYPFTLLNHNMIVSINYQHLYDFSRTWNFTLLPGDMLPVSIMSIIEADGGLYAWSLAYALQIVPQLSFGFTLNFWQDGIYQNAWETALTSTIVHTLPTIGDQVWDLSEVSETNRYSFSGFNANVGIAVEHYRSSWLWEPSSKPLSPLI